MSEPENRPASRRQLWVGSAVLALVGAAAMVFLNGSGLTSKSKYHTDLTQSPHWVAYHGDAFAADDLLVEYGSFNESPVQNAIHWVGTLVVDVVPLNKLVGIVIFGLTAALFYATVAATSGVAVGVLAALFFVIFPRSTYDMAAGFSKAWAIGFVMLAVHVVEARSWRILPWSMPFAALAYPISPVLMGAIVFVGLVMEYRRSGAEALRGLKYLVVGSALAIPPLLVKYLTPPEWVGEMVSSGEIRELWARGESTSVTTPIWVDLLRYLDHPFFVYGVVLLLMLLRRRGPVWKRSWTALVIASTIGYYVADLFVPSLYLPDRYLRFSAAVLLVLWFAYNGARLLAGIGRRWARRTAAGLLVVVAALSFPDTFRPCDGDKDQGVWEDKGDYAEMSAAIAAQPGRVLVAGHPYYTSEVMIQARRPVLVIHRMYHAWFKGYRAAVRERIEDTFRALYARETGRVDHLAERYGVTTLIVRKNHYRGARFRRGRMYRPEFHPFIRDLTAGRSNFVLNPPPQEAILFEDEDFWVVRLPLSSAQTAR